MEKKNELTGAQYHAIKVMKRDMEDRLLYAGGILTSHENYNTLRALERKGYIRIVRHIGYLQMTKVRPLNI